MRWRALLLACVLGVASCGSGAGSGAGDGGGDSTEGTAPVTEAAPELAPEHAPDLAVAEQVADELVERFGDQSAALGAVLLAADRGYHFDQISAAAAGGLQLNGRILDAGQAPVDPVYEPSNLLLDDLTGVQGFRTSPSTFSLTQLVREADEQHGRAALVVVLMLLGWGYSPEQVVTAILAGADVGNGFRVLDDDGAVIRPALPTFLEPGVGTDDGDRFDVEGSYERDVAVSATEPPTTDTASEPADSGDDDRLAAAAGAYRLQEQSLRVLVEPGVNRYLSAEGVIVIEQNGAVSGEYSYRYSEPGYDTYNETEFVSEVTVDATIDPATTPRLEVTENGLRFDATMDLAFLSDPSNGVPYVTPGASFDVTGIVDAESGLLELTVPGAEFALDFVR